jgi:2-iminobutanoate/2-iminopropanoate deaminase
MARRTAVTTPDAPAPVAAYSQAVRGGDVLAVAGQVGIDPATGEVAGPDVAAQTRQTLTNLAAILAAGGASWDDVIQLRVFLTDRADFPAMNEVYAEFVPDPAPARTTVFVGLAEGLLVEIDALAVVSS